MAKGALWNTNLVQRCLFSTNVFEAVDPERAAKLLQNNYQVLWKYQNGFKSIKLCLRSDSSCSYEQEIRTPYGILEGDRIPYGKWNLCDSEQGKFSIIVCGEAYSWVDDDLWENKDIVSYIGTRYIGVEDLNHNRDWKVQPSEFGILQQ